MTASEDMNAETQPSATIDEDCPEDTGEAMPTTPGNIDPIDPVFISYRQNDGTDHVIELAWLLRAAGIPVWRDRDDLPPGDTDNRLAEAIDAGISGAVLVITPDIGASRIVKTIEAPKIISLHVADPVFALAIVNAIRKPDGHLDYAAPDRLLERDPQILQGVDQKDSSRDGILAVVRQMVFHRVAELRPHIQAESNTFRLSIQTRNTPQVYDRTDSHLDLRIRPTNHERLPSPEGLRDLKDTLRLLPDSITRADSRKVVITGGAHLSVALALGAALPSSRVGEIDVLDQRGATWSSGPEAGFGDPPQLRVVGAGQRPSAATPRVRPATAIYLDLMPDTSDSAFEHFIAENETSLVEWRHLARTDDALIDRSHAGALAAEAAAQLRDISNRNGNAEVHVMLRAPFPMAILIGRLTNTLRLVSYEWDDSDPASGEAWGPRYVPALRLRTSASDGAIQEVLLA
jgi:hypothetical protein